MSLIGQFRDVDDPDKFVWLRGFSEMDARATGLQAFCCCYSRCARLQGSRPILSRIISRRRDSFLRKCTDAGVVDVFAAE